MSRVAERGKGVFFRGSRALEAVLPPGVLWFLLWPISALQAIRLARPMPRAVPARHLPPRPTDLPASAMRRWRAFVAWHLDYLPLLWLDRLSTPRWRSRFEVVGEDLAALVADRPAIVVSVHGGAIVMLAPWMTTLGLPVASIPADGAWLRSDARRRKAALAASAGLPNVFQVGSVREILDYLRPGRALMVAADFHRGRTVDVPWESHRLRLSTGPFRLARLAGAAVVPAFVSVHGRWRYRIHVLPPIPQRLVDADDAAGAAAHLAARLMPLAAEAPERATWTLLRALQAPVSGGPVAEARAPVAAAQAAEPAD
jgi:lauroyl/myristoyl acyltransferase